MKSSSIAAFCTSLLIVSVAPSAIADEGFSVEPIRVFIPAGNLSSALTISNNSDDVLRLQISGFAWTQNPDGSSKLTPSDDLVFFPTLATLNAHQSQVLRIGVIGERSDLERTFRVFIKELPAARTAGNAQQAPVSIETRFGVPVFLEPHRPASHLGSGGAMVKGDSLSFSLTNDGNAHALLRTIAVSALGADGTSVFTTSVPGWYVLAHGRWNLTVTIPTRTCSEMRSVKLVATDQTNESYTFAMPLGASECT